MKWMVTCQIYSEDKSLFTLSALHSSSLLPVHHLWIASRDSPMILTVNEYIGEAHLQMKKLGAESWSDLPWSHRSRVSLLPLGYWWPQAGHLIISPWRYWDVGEAFASPSSEFSVETWSRVWLIGLYSVSISKSFPGPTVFTMKGLLWSREAVWKLLSIINKLHITKRHNLTSPYLTKEIPLKLRELQLEGQSSWGGVSRQRRGECGQGAVLAALSSGTLLHDGIHFSPAPRHLHLRIPQRILIAGTESSILPRQHWKNNCLNNKRGLGIYSEKRCNGQPSGSKA